MKQEEIRVMFDMDGVFADFVSEFRAYAGLLGSWYPTNYWFQNDEVVSQKTTDEIFKRIAAVRNFWTTLDTLIGPDDVGGLWRLDDKFWRIQKYVVTCRVATRGRSVGWQTKKWLDQYGLYFPVYVALGHSKTDACKMLGITHAIEDCPQHAVDLTNVGIKCYLIDRLYNRQENTKYPVENIPRVKTVKEFCEKVMEEVE